MTTPYAIRHITRFTYDSPVSESVMELRMRPATDGPQRCLQFEVEVSPRARVFAYRDFLGNWVHHFDLPRRHTRLAVTARAQVQLDPPPERPAARAGRRREPGSLSGSVRRPGARFRRWRARRAGR